MKTRLSKFFPVLLCLLLCLCLAPAAFAADSTNASFQSFKAACQRGDRSFDLQNCGTFTITESISIPRGMSVNARGTSIVIPSGVTLDVGGELRADKVLVSQSSQLINNGYIYVYDSLQIQGSLLLNKTMHISFDAWSNVTSQMRDRIYYYNDSCIEVHEDANNWNDLLRLATWGEQHSNSHIRWIIELRNKVTLQSSLHIAYGVHLTSWAGLEIPSGVTMIVDGDYEARNNPLTIRGGLVNSRYIAISPPARLTVTGSIRGEGAIQIRGVTDPDIAIGYIDGLDLTDFTVFRYNDRVTYRPLEYFLNKTSFADAYQSKLSGDRAVLGRGEYVVKSDFVIPAGVTVEVRDGGVHVPAGVNLVVRGRLTAAGLNTLNGGNVIVDGGRISLLDGTNGYQGHGTWDLRDAHVDSHASLWPQLRNNPSISFSGGSIIAFHFDVMNEASVLSAFSAAREINGDHYVPCVEMGVAYTLTEDLEIAENLYVNLHESFTVSDAATLTLNGSLWADSGVHLDVDGSLVNNGFIDITGRTGTEAMLSVNGKYRGSGSIAVRDTSDPESYLSGVNMAFFSASPVDDGMVYAFSPKAAIVLPAQLTEIGEEAFADNSFTSVQLIDGAEKLGPRAFADCGSLSFIMIPASVQSIDETAFAGIEDLLILGADGSYAQRYAADMHFDFQPLPNS